MRRTSLLSLSAGCGLWLAFATASAQVTLDTGALAHLKPSPPPAAPRPPVAPAAGPARPVGRPSVAPPAPVAVPVPAMAAAPPEIAKLPPPVLVPTRPEPAPIPPKPVAAALGQASAIPNGIRLSFDGDSADLNPAMDQALRAFGHAALPGPVELDAYATSNSADPSVPRRLSLLRALAARAILINVGMASEKIYVRAHAPTADDSQAPADRLDIVDLAPHR